METTLAQVAHEILGIEVAKIKLVHGDTEYTPYSTGSWGSRSAVMAGGAVATATREVARFAKAIGAHLLQTDAESVVLRDGAVHGPSGSVTLAEIAHTWYRRPQDLPASVDPRGLEATIGYKPGRDSGTFSYAAHIATVAVDPETGDIEILDYVIVEDGGKLINPMVVDGQIYGGFAQGRRHRALRRNELRFLRPAPRVDLRRLSSAGSDRGSRASACATWRRLRPTPNLA